MIRLLTNRFFRSVFQPGLRLCSTTGKGPSLKKVSSIALSRLIPEANDYAVRTLPPEFRQLVRKGLKEAHNKNFQSALSLLQRAITCLPNMPANEEQRDAVEFYINEIKSKMRFLDNVENVKKLTPKNQFVKEVYGEVSSGNLFPRREKGRVHAYAVVYKSFALKRRALGKIEKIK